MPNCRYCNAAAALFWVAASLVCAPLTAQPLTMQEEVEFRFAGQLAERGLPELAAQQFSRFAEEYSGSPRAHEALFLAAENYAAVDSFARASEAYLTLILRHPQSPLAGRAQFGRAELLQRDGDSLAAALAFERVRLLDPEEAAVPEAQLRAARLFRGCGKLVRAADAVNFVLTRYPNHPIRHRARLELARIRAANRELSLALRELDRLKGERLEDELAVNVALTRSRLLERLGRYRAADSLLAATVTSPVRGDSAAYAAVRAVTSLYRRGSHREAVELAAAAVDKQPPVRYLAALRRLQGDCHFALGAFERALETYRLVPLGDLKPLDSAAHQLRLGVTLQRLDDPAAALARFDTLLALTGESAGLRALQDAALERAVPLLCQLGRPAEALGRLRRHLKRDSESDRILLQIARVQQQFLLDPEGARGSYETLLNFYPDSPWIDEAQLGIGRSYEEQDDLDLALKAYLRYLRLYPGADAELEVRERVDYLRRFAPPPRGDADRAFNRVLADQYTLGTGPDVVYAWAREQMITFHDYQRALRLLKRALQRDRDESLSRSGLLGDLITCHARLSEKHIRQHQPIKAAAHLDTLERMIDLMAKSDAGTERVQKARYQLARSRLLAIEPGSERAAYLDSVLRDFNSDSLRRHLELRLVEEAVAAGDAALRPLALAIADSLGSAEMDYYRAVLLIAAGAADSGAVLLRRFIRDRDRGWEEADARQRLARILERRGEIEPARALYSTILQRYPYSSRSTAAHRALARLDLAGGEYDRALQRLGRSDPLSEFDLPFAPVGDEERLWLRGRALHRAGDLDASLETLRRLILSSRSADLRARALFEAGEIASDMRRFETALAHFEELDEVMPDDSLAAAARVRAADLYFDRGRYTEALSGYSRLRNEQPDSLERHVRAREIVCRYKLGQIERADTDSRSFSNRFEDPAAQARLLYERGLALLGRKAFKQAEQTFKDLSSDFKKVPEGDWGELGLARLYVILNKTDEALKRLTGLPERSSDPEIVATAYLNLGDFYYENRQIENCIYACSRVLELDPNGPLRARAMRLLIDAYDDLALRDRAIALAREYLDIYPGADNAMSLRIRIGVLLHSLKEYERAIAHLRELAPLVDAESGPEVQYWIAKSYLDHGDTEQAIVEFLKVEMLGQRTKLPWGATALYEAGQAYRKLGQPLRARTMFEQVVRQRGAADQIGRVAQERIEEIDREIEDEEPS